MDSTNGPSEEKEKIVNDFKLQIIPAKFLELVDDEQCKIKCIVKGGSEVLFFEKEMIEHIDDPTYLFIGLMSGPGFVQANFTDAKDFEELFIEKWGCIGN